MKKIKFLIAAIIASTFTLSSCNSDDDGIENNSENIYKDGVFVLSEGAMYSSNSEVAFYKNGLITQNIFNTSNNGKLLGSIGQSMIIEDDLAYIVLNASNKIEVVNANSFISKATITSGLSNPRYLTSDDNYLYVSNWGDASVPTDDFISVYKLSDLSYVKKIDVIEGPEKIIIENGKLIIAHAGGWNNGNSVTIYNTKTDKSVQLKVGDVPSDIVEENNQVYVLCSGITWGGNLSSGKLVTIDLATEKITKSIDFKNGENPKFLVEENNQLYYTIYNKVYKVSMSATTLPQSPLFTTDTQYTYGLNVKNNAIYISDAKDFASNGEVKIYNQTGSIIGNFITGVGPNTILFN